MRIASLHLYPVKSCRGLDVAEARLDARGLEHDRRFMVVDATGTFCTQRELPRMAVIETALARGGLVLGAPGRDELWVPPPGPLQRTRPVTVWKSTVEGGDCGDEAAEWLSLVLGQPARLVRMGPGYTRRVNAARFPAAHAAALAGAETGFADGFPLLLATAESLADLNARLAAPVPMDRFRPNLVCAGAPRPWAEDDWLTLQTPAATLRVIDGCARCAVTTTDQRTGGRSREPLATLARFRRQPDGRILFAVNAASDTPGAVLRVGEPVTVTAVR